MTTREVSSQLSKTETHIVPNTGPIKDDAQDAHSPQSLVSRHRALSVTKLVDPRALVEAQQEAASKTTLDTGTDRIHAGARTPGSLAAEMEGHQDSNASSTDKSTTEYPTSS